MFVSKSVPTPRDPLHALVIHPSPKPMMDSAALVSLKLIKINHGIWYLYTYSCGNTIKCVVASIENLFNGATIINEVEILHSLVQRVTCRYR